MIYYSASNMPLNLCFRDNGRPPWIDSLSPQEKALHAIQMADVLLLGEALTAGVNLNNSNRPLLVEAARRRKTILCEYMLARGAQVNIANSLGQTAVYFAAQAGEKPLLKLLLERGADILKGDRQRTTPLMTAAFHGHLDCIELLVDRGADASERDAKGLSVMGYARHGRSAMLGERRRSIHEFQTLFKKDEISEAELNEAISDDFGELQAAERQYAQIVEFLRFQGAIDCKTPVQRLTLLKKQRTETIA